MNHRTIHREHHVQSSYDFPVVHVGGFPTAAITREALAEVMVRDCMKAREQGRAWLPRLVFSSNGQGIALAGRDKRFADAMDEADIIHADGMPVVFASRLTRHPLPERIATTDFFHDAARAAERSGMKFFLLGAKEEQNRQAVDQIRTLYPNLQIVGRHHGYFGPDEDEAVCAQICEAQPDVVWIALGKPRQEIWAVRNRERLAGVGWIKTCGGLYAFLSGDAPRAPAWMQSAGLEWLYRAIKEPRRLGYRYLVTNPYSLYRLARYTNR